MSHQHAGHRARSAGPPRARWAGAAVAGAAALLLGPGAWLALAAAPPSPPSPPLERTGDPVRPTAWGSREGAKPSDGTATVSVPVVAVGPSDGLAASLGAGTEATAAVAVLVTDDGGPATATLTARGLALAACPPTPVAPHTVVTIRCAVRALADGGPAQLAVTVSRGGHQLRAAQWTHTVVG